MQEVNEIQEETYKSGEVRYLDSREVAKIVEKEHKNLIRDITRYSKEITKLNFELSDFFIESSYKDVSGKSNKCYLVMKKS